MSQTHLKYSLMVSVNCQWKDLFLVGFKIGQSFKYRDFIVFFLHILKVYLVRNYDLMENQVWKCR